MKDETVQRRSKDYNFTDFFYFYAFLPAETTEMRNRSGITCKHGKDSERAFLFSFFSKRQSVLGGAL